MVFSFTGGIYRVSVDSVTSSFASITGTANLGGATVQAAFAPGGYVAKQYNILNATGGIGGSTFSGPVSTGLSSNFSSSLSYDANNAFLNLSFAFAPPSGGFSINQQNVANTLTNFFNTSGGIPMAFGALSPQRLTQVSGEAATGAQQTTFDAQNLFMSTMLDPFTAGRGGDAASSRGALSYAKSPTVAGHDAFASIPRKAPQGAEMFEARWNIWAAGYGGTQTTDGNATQGSATTTSRIYGGAAGADYRLSPDTLLGFALGGGGTNYSLADGQGRGSSDMFQAGFYGRHNIGALHLAGALAYGWQDITTDRTVTAGGVDHLRARFDANAFSGRIESGYRVGSAQEGLTPYAAVQFTTIYLPSYSEQTVSGANTFALNYGAKDATTTRSELGLRADTSYALADAVLTLRGRAAWAHNFDTERSIGATFQALPGASFVVGGAVQAREAALVSASAEARWFNGFTLAATFEGEFSDVTRSYAGKGVVKYAW